MRLLVVVANFFVIISLGVLTPSAFAAETPQVYRQNLPDFTALSRKLAPIVVNITTRHNVPSWQSRRRTPSAPFGDDDRLKDTAEIFRWSARRSARGRRGRALGIRIHH